MSIIKEHQRRRNVRILRLASQGWSLARIGNLFGITRARVSQILHANGIRKGVTA
jgi:predicted transcriptional regulator